MSVSLKKVSSALSLPAGCGISGISKTSPTTGTSLLSSGISSSMITLAGSMHQPTCQRQATSLQALLEGRILATGRTVASLGLDSASLIHGKSTSKGEESHGERRRHHQGSISDHHQPSTAQLAALALGTVEPGSSSNQQPSTHHHGGGPAGSGEQGGS
uniref:Uncharacterized protein n=1 Tax=Anopheles epiroticus TaxID=199890 RepID=A0A182PXX7_9DIPT